MFKCLICGADGLSAVELRDNHTDDACARAITIKGETFPVDLDGFPYIVQDWGDHTPWRLTKCCGAMVTYFDADLVCKGCYEDADPAADQPARLDANWKPNDGEPTVVVLDTLEG